MNRTTNAMGSRTELSVLITEYGAHFELIRHAPGFMTVTSINKPDPIKSMTQSQSVGTELFSHEMVTGQCS